MQICNSKFSISNQNNVLKELCLNWIKAMHKLNIRTVVIRNVIIYKVKILKKNSAETLETSVTEKNDKALKNGNWQESKSKYH